MAVPEIAIFLVITVILPLAVRPAKRYRHNSAEYLGNEVVKVILGDLFLNHMSPVESTNNHDEPDPERVFKRHMCRHLPFFFATAVLWWIVAIWWILLVEQITVDNCVTGADCFMIEQSKLKFNPDRIINCSNYSYTDGMMLICYKAGFYFLDACAKAGGALAIVSTTVKLYIPTIIACAKGQKKYFCIAGLITGCTGVLLYVAYILLPYLLSPNSNLLTLISGTNGVQLLPFLFAVILISIVTCTLSAQYRDHPEYEELPEN